LNSGALYYVERAVVFFAVVFIGLTLLGQGLRAQLALKVGTSGLDFGQQVEQTATAADAATKELDARISKLADDLEKDLSTVKTSLKKTTTLANATAKRIATHEQQEQHSTPGGSGATIGNDA